MLKIVSDVNSHHSRPFHAPLPSLYPTPQSKYPSNSYGNRSNRLRNHYGYNRPIHVRVRPYREKIKPAPARAMSIYLCVYDRHCPSNKFRHSLRDSRRTL